MKLRHAVVLALVHWYLMLPPMTRNGEIDTSAPLSKWSIGFSSFEFEQNCTMGKMGVLQSFERRRSNTAGSKGSLSLPERRWRESKCVAVDDPRLKGK